MTDILTTELCRKPWFCWASKVSSTISQRATARPRFRYHAVSPRACRRCVARSLDLFRRTGDNLSSRPTDQPSQSPSDEHRTGAGAGADHRSGSGAARLQREMNWKRCTGHACSRRQNGWFRSKLSQTKSEHWGSSSASSFSCDFRKPQTNSYTSCHWLV